jgi:hypothetical protein
MDLCIMAEYGEQLTGDNRGRTKGGPIAGMLRLVLVRTLTPPSSTIERFLIDSPILP